MTRNKLSHHIVQTKLRVSKPLLLIPQHKLFSHPLCSYLGNLFVQSFAARVPLKQVHHFFQCSLALADVVDEIVASR